MLSPARARFWTEKADAAWPEATRQRRDAALERGEALLQHVVRRVHDAGVDVAQFLEREQVGGVLGVELVGRGLVDRHRDGPWLGRRASRRAGRAFPDDGFSTA